LKAALPLSAAGHAAIVALLLLLPATMPAPPKIDLSNAVEVVFAPPPAPPQPPPQPPPPEPPQPVLVPPPPAPEPPPPPTPIEQPPPPPAPVAETPPPPPPKPEPRPPPKPKPRPVQQVQPVAPPMPLLPLPLPLPTQPAAPQVASIPRPAPAPTISPDYRSLLSGWLESHKRYPEDARQRGEEGRAVLRFRVDRYGRVLDYAVVGSTGFADLDAAVQNMMHGATLPPFPASMTEPEIEVSVTIRFGLSR
jgi:protein TonB